MSSILGTYRYIKVSCERPHGLLTRKRRMRSGKAALPAYWTSKVLTLSILPIAS